MNELEELSILAKVSEIAERYEDCIKYMDEIIKKKKEDLTKEEKNIFYNSYKNIINSKRCSLRNNILIYEKEKKNNSQYMLIVENFKTILENEISDLSKGVINLITMYLLKKLISEESKVFYLKMRGDYYRYLCEVTNNNEQYVEEAEKNYKEANDIAQNFPWSLPIKLALFLNTSVFYFEIKKNANQALKIAKKAIKAVKKELGKINDEENKDIANTFQTLKENVTIWDKE